VLTTAGVTLTQNAKPCSSAAMAASSVDRETLYGQELHCAAISKAITGSAPAPVVAEIDQDPPNHFLRRSILDPRSDFWT